MAKKTKPPVILNRQRKYRIPVLQLKRFASRLLQHLEIPHKQFTLLLINDRIMRRFNDDFRNNERTTDVLSFPLNHWPEHILGFEKDYLGDMIISVEKAQQQAFEREHPLERELKVLMVHGLLHLLGYDHETDQGRMRRKEMRLQRELL